MTGSPALADGTAYIGSDDKTLYAIDAKEGEVEWTFDVPYKIFTSPAVADGIIYLTHVGHVYAIEDDGSEHWKMTLPDELGGQIKSSPAVTDDTVYFGTGRNYKDYIFALDTETGDDRWRIALPQGEQITNSPAVADGVVCLGNSSGELLALEAADSD